MTAPKPLLPLTSTERRLAEIAYAANVGSADAAVRVVYRYRGEYGRPETVADGEAMLEELRRDHVDSMLMHNRALANERDRYRELIERIVDEHDRTPEGAVAWGMASAINDARKALEAGSR